MGAGLGLAILSSACRLPEVAAGEQLATRLPLLLRVLTAGGVTPLINRGAGSAVAGAASGTSNGTGTGTGSTANAGADEHAVAEALECVVAACSASPSGARGAVLAAGGLGAAAAVLSRTCLSAHKRKAAAASGALSAGSGGLGSWHVPMLAVRLLNLLLTCSTGQRAELVHGERSYHGVRRVPAGLSFCFLCQERPCLECPNTGVCALAIPLNIASGLEHAALCGS